MKQKANEAVVVEDQQQEEEVIEIYGAREHNLKNIDLVLPKNKLIVFTGLSGSGKSSLAFDTIYAEGQRRFMETFSAYARQFIGSLQRPEVDKIEGLSPVISIEQKTVSKSPRSSVGTITEIYDFLRLLYARVGVAFSYISGNKMLKYSEDQILGSIEQKFDGKQIVILSPLVKGRKGHYRELFEQYRKLGFTKMRIDGKLEEIKPDMKLSRYKIHDIDLYIDKFTVAEKASTRLRNAVALALKHGNGNLAVLEVETEKDHLYSKNLMDPESGVAYDDPQPNSFSFNSPYGYCPKCKGIGTVYHFDLDKIFPDKNLSISKGAIAPLGKDVEYWFLQVLKALATKFSFKLSEPVKNLPPEVIDALLYGVDDKLEVESEFGSYKVSFEGLLKYLDDKMKESKNKESVSEDFAFLDECDACQGYRLKKESLFFRIDGKHIGEAANMQLDKFADWINSLEILFTGNEKIVASEILKEISSRTRFLLDVGLHYLSLNRPAGSISGGEAQRIRLATQIGSQLINVLYILDEPSIGLHQRDNMKLITALKELRDIGNSVLVVEHDMDMIRESDYVVDLGPGAGVHGGEIVAQGTPEEFMSQNSVTAQYISGERKISIPETRRKGNGKTLELVKANGHNLKDVTVKFPLGKLICITGVSGSGKSSLVTETLFPILQKHFYRSSAKPLPYEKVNGLKNIDKVIEIDQTAIGRTPRSNPATYTGVFTLIRNLFTELPEAKIRGYKPGRFSFNVKGGRCEGCHGAGVKIIEMNFLPDVHVECSTCLGKRYNRETLEVRYKGKSIGDVLDMTIEDAVEFFGPIPSISRKIKTISDVGLGYIRLGQPSTTLSGGEAQRVKLATELSRRDTGNTFYILDEPTTGLHFEDIRILMNVINELVEKGNTVAIIEHNMDVIKLADWIIDIGPEGGDAGGEIVSEGTPEEVIAKGKGHTTEFLKLEMERF